MGRKRVKLVLDAIVTPAVVLKDRKKSRKPVASAHTDRPKSNGAYFKEEKPFEFYSTGCRLLDCCVSGNGKGWAENQVINLVGDKATGKSLLACEAAANYLSKYPNAKVWYRDVEARFDKGYVASLGIPVSRFDMNSSLFTVEDVFEDMQRKAVTAKRGLYVVDSLDALSDRSELGRAMDEGTYGANKAKKLSELFRRLHQKLSQCGISVIFISQIRDKIGVRFGERYSRAGGKSLDFYASQIVWLSVVKSLNRTVDGVERQVGELVRAKVKKCSVGPPFRTCDFPILFNYGVCDVSASVGWLQQVRATKEVGLDSKEVKRLSSLKSVASMDKEEYDYWRDILGKKVRRVWKRIEASFSINRHKY